MGTRLTWPGLDWTHGYDRATLSSDLVAAVIVTLMLIPQSLAYASLAGLPPQVGLYASIAPLLFYAAFGSSRVLAVGPVAVVSLMTAAAIGDLAQAGSPAYGLLAITLAFISGAMLLLMGLLRLGFLANFLSHPVISGFITASALLIAAGQLKVILGIQVPGHNFFESLPALILQLPNAHALSAAIGLGTVAFLFWAKRGVKPLLRLLGLGPRLADALARAAPVAGIAVTAVLTWASQWHEQGVRIVGTVPQGVPPLTLPSWDLALWQQLAVPALLISVVGFVESVSVGQTLAAKRRQRIEPDRELVALGASNLGAALTGGFPVTGGFARSVVNFDAGAQTPAAGIFTAIGIFLAALLLTPALYFVPQATLARHDCGGCAVLGGSAYAAQHLGLFATRFFCGDRHLAAHPCSGCRSRSGGRCGLIAPALTFTKPAARTSQKSGWCLARSISAMCFATKCRSVSQLASLRVDESLYFANARVLEDRVNALVSERPELRHLVMPMLRHQRHRCQRTGEPRGD